MFFFFACATQSGKSAPFVYLTNSARFELLPPSELESPLDMAQTVAAVFKGEEYFFNSWVKADENALDIAVFNEFGIDIGQLHFDGENISFSSGIAPANLKPEYIAADFELCFFKSASLAAALKKAKLDFVALNVAKKPPDAEANIAQIRRVFDGKKLIIEIEKTAERVKLTNHLRNYEYVIEGDFAEKAAQ